MSKKWSYPNTIIMGPNLYREFVEKEGDDKMTCSDWKGREIKKGDRVIITRKEEHEGVWCPEMCMAVGQLGTVNDVGEYSVQVRVDYGDGKVHMTDYWYPLSVVEKVEVSERDEEREMTYLERQKDCGIKEGDRVRVIRNAEDYEDGWNCRWISDMDSAVGKVGIVKRLGMSGVALSIDKVEISGYSYPYFVLEKVEELPEQKGNFFKEEDVRKASDAVFDEMCRTFAQPISGMNKKEFQEQLDRLIRWVSYTRPSPVFKGIMDYNTGEISFEGAENNREDDIKHCIDGMSLVQRVCRPPRRNLFYVDTGVSSVAEERWNTTCPNCGGRAYQGLSRIECEKKCK